MALPEGVQTPIIEAGETVLEFVVTAARRAFVGDDGTEVTADLYAVATDQRLWLVAHSPVGQWVAACGNPSQVALQSGWTQDTLVTPRFRIPVARLRRGQAEAVVAAFRAGGGGGGDAAPAAPTLPDGRAQAAGAAWGVPDWLPRQVPADPDERWLHAARTRSTHPFNLDDGSIARGRVFIAATQRRTVLAASVPGMPAWARPLSHPLRLDGARLHAGARELRGVEDPDVVAALSRGESDARWRVAIGAAVLRRDARSALQLIAEAQALGENVGMRVLARLLLAVGRPTLAVACARDALDSGPVDIERELAIPHDTDPRDLERQNIDVHVIRSLVAEVLRSVEPAGQTGSLPWPPMSLREVWAAAWAPRDPQRALALWQRAPAGERRHRAVGTLLELASEPGAADAWERAALEQRGRNRSLAAATLDRAISVGATPARLWLRGSWALEDGREPEAKRSWARALDLDPGGTFAIAGSAAQERAIAEVALEQEAWRPAAGFLRRAAAAAPEDRATHRQLARVLAERLGAFDEASAALDVLLEHPSDGDDTDGPIRLEQARYRIAAADPAGAAAALRAAVAADFLHPAVWEEACRLAPDAGLDPAWWGHIHRTLTADDPGPGRGPIERLPTEARDALHPGGVGFVERLRQAVDTSSPPPRAELVRGLERLTTTTHPELTAQISALCARLEIAAPHAYLFRGEGAFGCSAWATKPPVLLIGADHLSDGPRALSADALGFLLAVELVHLACEHPVLTFDTNLRGASTTMYRAFGRFAGTAEDLVNVVTLLPGVDQLAKLQRVILLSRRVFAARTAVDKASGVASTVLDWLGIAQDAAPASGVGREGLAGATLAFRMQADRAALLLTGDLAAATDAILRASSQSLAHAARTKEHGLAAVLEDAGPPAEALRLAALVSFAATI